MNDTPKDPIMFVSFANTELRDMYPSLHEFCMANSMKDEEALSRAARAGFEYNMELNRFI